MKFPGKIYHMPLRTILLTFSLVFILIFASCSGSAGAIDITADPVIEENPNSAAPLAAVLTFETNVPVTTQLQVSDGEHEWQLTYDTTFSPGDGLPVVGMRPDREHTIRITLQDQDGNLQELEAELTFHTPPLPDDPGIFPSIAITESSPDQMESGYTLLNPRRRLPRETQLGNEEEQRFGANFGMLLMVDAQGVPVWYYLTDSRISDFDYLGNGRIQYVTQDFRIMEIDMLGNVINSWYAANRPEGDAAQIPVETLTFHHDADRLPNGNILALSTEQRILDNYYTDSFDAEAPRATQPVMGDLVIEFNQAGEILWSWNAFEYMDPYRIGYFMPYWKRRGFPETVDWSHANSLVNLPEENAVLVNFRLLSAIVKISRESGEIEWIFGEPSGWSESNREKLISLEGDVRWPWHQPAPVFTSRGNLLLFDNGNFHARPYDETIPIQEAYSRAAEYEIDQENRTARQIWTSEIPGEEPVLSVAMGNVSELPETGNILIGYGAILEREDLSDLTWATRARADQWTMTREVTRTDPPKIVWEMQLRKTGSNPEIGWNIFGVKRIQLFQPDSE